MNAVNAIAYYWGPRPVYNVAVYKFQRKENKLSNGEERARPTIMDHFVDIIKW